MEIVFVHFGSFPPKHLIKNLNRTCKFFPDTTVTLITDAKFDNLITHNNFQRYDFQLGTDYRHVDRQMNHPKDFRNNFWFTSLARLIALCDYVIEKENPILHIESDVLVSQDFPLESFDSCDRSLAYTMVGHKSGVASILWLRDVNAAKNLRNYIYLQVQLDPMTTDMKVLGHFQWEFPDKVRILASFPIRQFNLQPLVSAPIIQDMIYTEKLFGGYFDAADAGQYLLGDDPRNNRGKKFLRRELETSFFKPSHVKFSYSKARNFLNIASEEVNRYFSLHIHSKSDSMFVEGKLGSLLLRAVENQSCPEKQVLVPAVFLSSIKNALIRRVRKWTNFKT